MISEVQALFNVLCSPGDYSFVAVEFMKTDKNGKRLKLPPVD